MKLTKFGVIYDNWVQSNEDHVHSTPRINTLLMHMYTATYITCIILPLHVEAVTKVVDATSTPSCYSRSSCYDHCILSFVDIEAEECIKHVGDKEEEEEMEDDRGSYGAPMHGSTLTILSVLITLWT